MQRPAEIGRLIAAEAQNGTRIAGKNRSAAPHPRQAVLRASAVPADARRGRVRRRCPPVRVAPPASTAGQPSLLL